MKKIIFAFIVILLMFCITACTCVPYGIVKHSRSDADNPEKSKGDKSNTYIDETDSFVNSGAEITQAVEASKADEIPGNFFAGLGGKVSYGFHNYKTDEKYIHNSCAMVSASIIKLFIMEYAFSQINAGAITGETVVDGYDIDYLVESMITVSDNDSTNILIEYFGMDTLNDFFALQGYGDTLLERKMLDFDAQAQGKENYTSVSDVMKFLDNLYASKDVFPQKDMLDIMKKQTVETKIRRDIPANVVIANKTGELSDVENDAGIIFTGNGDFAFVALTNDVDDTYLARNVIAETALGLYNYYK